MGMLARILRTGRVAEPAPTIGPSVDAPSVLRGALSLRHVDTGSCNGCEIEISGCFSPTYDIERYGVRLVASPRHADGLLVTGAVTRNMSAALRKTYEATPGPKIVVAVGDCAQDCGLFAGGPGVEGRVSDFVPVDAVVPGCPPRPDQIIAALRQVTGK